MTSPPLAADVPRLPTRKQRLTVVGRTGSGKTVASLWHLSKHSIDSQPWIIFNFKTDELIDSLQDVGAQFIDLSYVPKKPGIYILHPLPSDAKSDKGSSKVNEYLWQIWEKKNIGIYCDEGYMMGDGDAFQACLTQGRSRHIPMIVCAQRPAWLSRFVFSEMDFCQVFDLNDRRDRITVEQFIPVQLDEFLPDYHSYYYDVGKKKMFKFSPVPKEEIILKAIDARIPKRKQHI